LRSKKQPKKRSKKSAKVSLTLLQAIFLITPLALIFTGIGYYLGYVNAFSASAKQQQAQSQKSQALMQQLASLTQQDQLKQQLKAVLSKDTRLDARHEIDDNTVPPPLTPVKPTIRPKKPLLTIIIDDISFKEHIRRARSTHLNLTLSFLPPNAIHPHSAELAKTVPYYMVHLPMEAMHFNKEEKMTLHSGDSAASIFEKIALIKALFPKVHYINNHTGSKFTADMSSMLRLFRALDYNGIRFVDSRTTAKTVVPKIMQQRHKPYVARQIFLDHTPTVVAIKEQIKKAVKRAKRDGYAIAIGHPKKETIEALKQSKGVLKEVRLVRIDELYKMMRW